MGFFMLIIQKIVALTSNEIMIAIDYGLHLDSCMCIIVLSSTLTDNRVAMDRRGRQ